MRTILGVIAASVLLSGCGGGSYFGTSSPSPGVEGSSGQAASNQASSNIVDRTTDFFFGGGSSKPRQVQGEPPPPDDIICPDVAIREGASTLAINAPGEPSAMTVRYQGSIARTARDCSVVAKTMHMKVGIEGRIVVGPAGGPGKVEVPLRLAIVREGPKPLTILTKAYRQEVVIDPNKPYVEFVQVDDTISFPMPSASDLEMYVVYVGFDPQALKKPAPRKPRARKRARQ